MLDFDPSQTYLSTSVTESLITARYPSTAVASWTVGKASVNIIVSEETEVACWFEHFYKLPNCGTAFFINFVLYWFIINRCLLFLKHSVKKDDAIFVTFFIFCKDIFLDVSLQKRYFCKAKFNSGKTVFGVFYSNYQKSSHNGWDKHTENNLFAQTVEGVN